MLFIIHINDACHLYFSAADIKIHEGRSYYDERDYKEARASFSEAVAIRSKYSQSMTMDSKFLEDDFFGASCYMKVGKELYLIGIVLLTAMYIFILR